MILQASPRPSFISVYYFNNMFSEISSEMRKWTFIVSNSVFQISDEMCVKLFSLYCGICLYIVSLVCECVCELPGILFPSNHLPLSRILLHGGFKNTLMTYFFKKKKDLSYHFNILVSFWSIHSHLNGKKNYHLRKLERV